MSTQRIPRHGVLLLIVLSLLVLFTLVGVTFIVTAGQFQRSTVIAAQRERSGDPVPKLMQNVIHQIVRDTYDTRSALLGHSLLRDLYGTDALYGKIESFDDQIAQGQLTSIVVVPNARFLDPKGNSLNLAPETGYFNGGVLTFTTGNAAGQSTRILRHTVSASGQNAFVIKSVDGLLVGGQAGDRFVVNGLPLNGTGAGYNTRQPTLDLNGDMVPDVVSYNLDLPIDIGGTNYLAAYLPNYSAYPSTDVWSGGLDEGYDIADFQNMLLAWVPANLDRQRQPFDGQPTVTAFSHLIPSLHRPALAYYQLVDTLKNHTTQLDINSPYDLENPANTSTITNALSLPTAKDLMRATILRPTKLDHPNFTGSNPGTGAMADILGFNPVTGPWDVDNDGNGIADSVWVDVGLPVRQDQAGRLYKPLMAILCQDLDGRINLNAAGHYQPVANLATNGLNATSGTNPGSSAAEPHGAGYGPFEIELSTPDPARIPALTALEADAILYSETDNLRGRFSGVIEANDSTNPAGPGVFGADDDNALVTSDHGRPYRFSHYGTENYYNVNTYFGTPSDVHGIGVSILSHRGQVILSARRNLLVHLSLLTTRTKSTC